MIVSKSVSLILLAGVNNSFAANILFFINVLSSHSHRAGLEPLANRLADNGHNVTFFGPLEPVVKHPKIINVCPPEVKTFHEGVKLTIGVSGLDSRIKSKGNVDIEKGSQLADMLILGCEVMLKSPGFQDWVNSSSYDLIVFDKSSVPECAAALSYKWNSKVMGYYGVGFVYILDKYIYGISLESSWVPFFTAQYETQEIPFFQRLSAEILGLAWYYQLYNYFLPNFERLARTYLDVDGMPPLVDVIASQQILLLNLHYSDQFPLSLPPFMIPVGGMHLTDTKGPLHQDLEDFIESGENGFFYISFGSIISISSIPESLLDIFFNALRELDLQFIWKWEGEQPKNIPANVLLQPWLPQKALLGHAKIRGFITQGGQVSMQEAIYNGVPVLIFPVNGDQDYNAKRLRKMGNGIEMELSGLTSNILKDAILRLLNDERYSQMAKLLSKASRDRPLSALETAVWWTEYVLRNDKNATDFLKPFCSHQPWWMKMSLDVWGFVFVALLICFASLLFFIKILVFSLPKFLSKCMAEKIKTS